MITLYFDLDPKVKSRPRFSRKGSKTLVYTPAQTKNYERIIKMMGQRQYRDKPLKGPIKVEINFYFVKPKSSKQKYPINKRSGDLDNLAKAVLDSLNKIVYEDDSQVIALTCSKYYRITSGIEVKIYAIN